MQVPLLDLKPQFAALKEQIMPEIEEICDSQYFVNGPKVEKFEKEAAEYCNCDYAVGVSSGSDALLISLMSSEIGSGDEVITSPFTFFATAGAIARVGATPVFVDIHPRVFNIDPSLIEEKITSKTKAIIPVHLFGQSAEMGPIINLAKKHDLLVIEDAAQAIGSEYEGKRIGSLSDFGCFSFFPSKNLGAFGDAGLVTSNDQKIYEKLKIFRNHGSNPKYYHKYIGGNFRLDALQAGILSIKLSYLDEWTKMRQQNAADYRTLFAQTELDGLIELPMKADYRTRHIYNQFSILVKDGKRNLLLDALRKAQIGCDIYYPVSLHNQDCFNYLGYKEGDFPVSESVTDEILAIPIYPESSHQQREYVVDTIVKTLL